MKRRGMGVAAAKKKEALAQKAQEVGQQQQANSLNEMKGQLLDFKNHLEGFAVKHKKEINENPLFRRQFLKMCQECGVDPLSSNKEKGMFSKLLSRDEDDDFYYELAIQITNICIALRPKNGGYLEMSECHRLLNKLRGDKAKRVQIEDISKALVSLQQLSADFKIVQTGKKCMIVSTSVDFNSD